MKVSLSSRIDFGRSADKSVTCFTLVPETTEDKVLVQAMYGLQAKVSTCVPFIEVVFSRKVDF